MESELLPCPFCGSDEHHELQADAGSPFLNNHALMCGKCGARIALQDSKEQAVTTWNTRADHQRLLDEVAALKQEHKELRDYVNEYEPRLLMDFDDQSPYTANNQTPQNTEASTKSVKDLVCVLCGEPWLPTVKNRCECGGFCSWGEKKGGDPMSWDVTDKGWTPKPVPPEVVEKARKVTEDTSTTDR